MTNGFNISEVYTAMFKRIGWRASTQASQPTLSSNNTTSSSGRYFNDAHALVTIPNVKAIQDDAVITDNNFNTALEALQKAVIMRSLTAVFNAPEFLEQVLLYEREGHNDISIPNEGLFVGYEIEVSNIPDKAVQIDSATFLLDGDKTFNVYLFKDGKKSAIKTQEITVVANEATVVDFTDWVLNYISPSTKGGRFYIGYFQDDLGSVKAIGEQVEKWNDTLCFSAEPFAAAKISGETNFNRDYHIEPGIAYGFNLQLSSYNDWTALIVKRANIFDELVMLNMAYTVIERLIYTTRSNGTERILKEGITLASAMADLTGSAPVSDGPPPVVGLNKRIEREALRVKKSLFPNKKAVTVNLC